MIKFEPISDYIVIQRLMGKGSKVLLPDTSQEASDDIFEVMSVGPGDDSHPQFLKVGDVVCLVGYINTFTYQGEKVIMARARDVMAIIKEE